MDTMAGKVVKLGEFSYIWNLPITEKLYYKSPRFKLKINNEFDCHFDLYFSQNLELGMLMKSFHLLLKEKNLVSFEAFVLNNNMEKIHHLMLTETKPCYTDNVEYKSSSRKEFVENVFRADKDNILDDTKLMILLEVKPNHVAFQNSPIKNGALADFEYFFTNEEFSDITIIVEDKVFKVHKAILIARSPTFSQMLINANQNHQISINDVTSEIMQEILRFIYTGKVENGEAFAKDLLFAACKFEMDDLKELAEMYLCNSLKVDNVIDTLCCADASNSEVVLEQAIHFLVNNYEEWCRQSDGNSLQYLPSDVLVEAFLQACSQ